MTLKHLATQADEVVDARGRPAKATVATADAGLRRLSPGETLEIRVSDPEASGHLYQWAGLSGHDFLGAVGRAGWWSVHVRRGARGRSHHGVYHGGRTGETS
jgi:TusA-related sulfurtransferase